MAELLDDLHLEPHLAHPARCKAIASARLKDDRVDARTLAHLLRSDLLPEAWLAPADVRDLRVLLRHRVSLVRLRTSLKNRIHSVLADRGIQLEGSLWTADGRGVLEPVELSPGQRALVDDSLALIDSLAPAINRLDREIRRRAKPDPYVSALLQLPGIGLITGMTLVAEIGDISRFPSARKLCAWAGLVPTVRNSDRTVRHGHITKQGSPWVRWVMIEAAHVACRRAPYASTYAAIARRRGKNIAAVAIARKLLARSFHVLKEVSADQPSTEKASVPGPLALADERVKRS